MKILANRAAHQDKGITYNTAQFSHHIFESGNRYIIEFENGILLKAKASRNGKTLYTENAINLDVPQPEIGKKVVHKIHAVYKQLTQGF